MYMYKCDGLLDVYCLLKIIKLSGAFHTVDMHYAVCLWLIHAVDLFRLLQADEL